MVRKTFQTEFMPKRPENDALHNGSAFETFAFTGTWEPVVQSKKAKARSTRAPLKLCDASLLLLGLVLAFLDRRLEILDAFAQSLSEL